MEESNKLYSIQAIDIATFFGGPLAAGILIRRNCISLGRERQGLNSLMIGILSTLLLFGALFLIPVSTIEQVPNLILPAIYTLIIHLIVEKIQGKELKEYKAKEGYFYSGWRAAGIGALSSVVIIGFFIGLIYFSTDNWDTDKYIASMDEFGRNETEALKLFELLNSGSKSEIINFIDLIGIPKWNENKKILADLQSLEDLPRAQSEIIDLLSEYCDLRIELYSLILLEVDTETAEYESRISACISQINAILEKLK
jgi:hypothetical protein